MRRSTNWPGSSCGKASSMSPRMCWKHPLTGTITQCGIIRPWRSVISTCWRSVKRLLKSSKWWQEIGIIGGTRRSFMKSWIISKRERAKRAPKNYYSCEFSNNQSDKYQELYACLCCSMWWWVLNSVDFFILFYQIQGFIDIGWIDLLFIIIGLIASDFYPFYHHNEIKTRAA